MTSKPLRRQLPKSLDLAPLKLRKWSSVKWCRRVSGSPWAWLMSDCSMEFTSLEDSGCTILEGSHLHLDTIHAFRRDVLSCRWSPRDYYRDWPNAHADSGDLRHVASLVPDFVQCYMAMLITYRIKRLADVMVYSSKVSTATRDVKHRAYQGSLFNPAGPVWS